MKNLVVWLVLFVLMVGGAVAGFLTVPPVVQAQASGLCDQTASISQGSGTSVVIVGKMTGFATYVCGFVVSADTVATTAQFRTGTGTTCGTGTLNLTGAMRMCDECNISYGGHSSVVFQAPLDTDFCLTTATGAVTGFVNFGRR